MSPSDERVERANVWHSHASDADNKIVDCEEKDSTLPESCFTFSIKSIELTVSLIENLTG
jgi:hypothetical protein